jgi:RNA polymerase sigma-70 factor (sigma-E family)
LSGQEVEMVEPDVTFREFVVARSTAMLRSAYLLTGDRGRAEDLLQTALVKAWPRWSRVNRDGTGEAYVRRVMYTTYATWWRRRWRGEVPTAELPDAVARDAYASVAERTELLRALAELSAGQRAVVVLRYFEDRSEVETAELLGCSVGTVKSQCARALARLRQSPILTALVEEER